MTTHFRHLQRSSFLTQALCLSVLSVGVPVAALAETTALQRTSSQLPRLVAKSTTKSMLAMSSPGESQLELAGTSVTVADFKRDLNQPGTELQAFLDTRVTNGVEALEATSRMGDTAEKVAAPPVAEKIAMEDTSSTPGSLMDNGAEALRRKLLINPLAVGAPVAYSPGSTAGSPSAFGANFGDAFTGFSLSSRRPTSNEADGAFSTGFGLGDARSAVGLEVNVSAGSIRRFGANGDVGLKLHRNLPGNAAVAIGWDSGITWGSENRDSVSTLYGVATKAFPLKPGDKVNSMPLTVSLGIGGGRFRSFNSIEQGRNTVGVFGSLGLQVAPQASVVSTWTGRDLNLGVSFVPIKTTPVFVTAVAANVLGNSNQNTLFSFSVGYGFNYSGAFR